jgi:hypothetical protein
MSSIAPDPQPIQTSIATPVSTPVQNPITTPEYTVVETLSPGDVSDNAAKSMVNFNELFYPSGWMGDKEGISALPGTQGCMGSASCLEITWKPTPGGEEWAGIYWQSPKDNWGDEKGLDLSGYNIKKLTFMARGDKGGEKSIFKFGGISGTYSDSVRPAIELPVTLSREWKEYSIDLTGKDLSNVIGGFCWVVNNTQCPKGCTIFVDKIGFSS